MQEYSLLVSYFGEQLKLIDTENRNRLIEVFKEVPEDFYYKPSTSSNRYHNSIDNLTHGLLYHTRRVCIHLESIMKSYTMVVGEIKKVDIDSLRTAAILHDICKWSLNGTHTNANHDTLGSDYAKSKGFNDLVCEAIRYHSGYWSTDLLKNGGKGLREIPHFTLILMLHLADMTASSADDVMFIGNPETFDFDAMRNNRGKEGYDVRWW